MNPANLVEAREAFMEDPTVDPEFEYDSSERYRERQLRKFPLQTQLLTLAERIIERAMRQFGSHPRYVHEVWGPVVDTPDEAVRYFKRYLADLGLESDLTLRFSTTVTAQTSVGKKSITLKMPCGQRRHRLVSTCDHEIGTHYLRRWNDQRAPWYGRRKAHGMPSPELETEEGLASLNTHVAARCKLLLYSAVSYCACVWAQGCSFSQLYRRLNALLEDRKKAFEVTVRVRRGLSSQEAGAGAYCKDQRYLSGAVALLRARRSVDFRILYAGRIPLHVVPKVARVLGLASAAPPASVVSVRAGSRSGSGGGAASGGIASKGRRPHGGVVSSGSDRRPAPRQRPGIPPSARSGAGRNGGSMRDTGAVGSATAAARARRLSLKQSKSVGAEDGALAGARRTASADGIGSPDSSADHGDGGGGSGAGAGAGAGGVGSANAAAPSRVLAPSPIVFEEPSGGTTVGEAGAGGVDSGGGGAGSVGDGDRGDSSIDDDDEDDDDDDDAGVKGDDGDSADDSGGAKWSRKRRGPFTLDCLRLPPFLRDLRAYYRALDEIAIVNGIDDAGATAADERKAARVHSATAVNRSLRWLDGQLAAMKAAQLEALKAASAQKHRATGARAAPKRVVAPTPIEVPMATTLVETASAGVTMVAGVAPREPRKTRAASLGTGASPRQAAATLAVISPPPITPTGHAGRVPAPPPRAKGARGHAHGHAVGARVYESGPEHR